MELFIFIAILVVVTYVINKGKTKVRKDKLKDGRSISGKKLTDDEIVTVILPTISNDGK